MAAFLDERSLPDGTTYKIESGAGDIKNQGPTQPDARRDFTSFNSESGRLNTEEWWRENLDLDSYFTFRAINRAINNMDIREGWNHYMYHNPETNKWTVIPWDLDMLYVPSTHWSGTIQQKTVLRHDALEIEYQNRARELQDLLVFSRSSRATGRRIRWLHQSARCGTDDGRCGSIYVELQSQVGQWSSWRV